MTVVWRTAVKDSWGKLASFEAAPALGGGKRDHGRGFEADIRRKVNYVG